MNSTHRRETITMNSRDDRIIDIRSCTETTKEQYEIYNALVIKQTPLSRLIIMTPTKKNEVDSVTTKCRD